MSTPQGPVSTFSGNLTIPQIQPTGQFGGTPFMPSRAVPEVKTATTPTASPPPVTPQFTTPSGAVLNAQGGMVSPPPTPQISQETTSGAVSTPQVPQVPPETQKAVQSAEQAIQDALKISPDELSTQADLDRLVESTKTAFQNTSDQPIPLEFITGQLKSIENRALNLAEPLERKLARLQAQRQASLESSQFSLDRADKDAEIARKEAEKTPSAEGFTLGKGQIRFDSEGNIIAQGPSEVSTIGVTGSTSSVSGADNTQFPPEVQAWANLINEKRADLNNVPSGIRNLVATAVSGTALADTPAAVAKQQGNISKSDTVINAIDNAIKIISKNPILNPIVGTAFGRGTLGKFIPGEASTLEGYMDTVRANVGFDALQQMRDSSPTGGALGQVSEREIGFLQSVAGSLKPGQENHVLIENLEDIQNSFKTLRALSIAESGREVPVTVTDPETGETISATVNKKELENLLREGNQLTF